MPFGHDMVRSLTMVVELVNTSPAADGEERLPTLEELRELIDAHEVSGVPTLTLRDLNQVRQLRADFHRIFTAPDQATAVRLLNTLLAGTKVTANLAEHDGHGLHMHYFAPGASLCEHLSADGGVALAHLLVEGEWERLRTCTAPDCDRVFVDESRNRSRVYCDSRTCGNRMHVAAYRARRRV